MPDLTEAQTDAEISPCGKYRYTLWRQWEKCYRYCLFIMLNPSTADASQDDPTIRRCIGFAKSWDYGALAVVNLFAYRATKPSELRTVADPVGPDNDARLKVYIRDADMVIAAWGANPAVTQERVSVVTELNYRLFCLGKTQAGHPKHPLFISRDTKLETFYTARTEGSE